MADDRPQRKPRMSAPKRIDSKERRRRLIERLNEKEKVLETHSSSRDEQMSEGERAVEIEKERQRNFSRRGFSQMWGA
jgi:hypothetical protein